MELDEKIKILGLTPEMIAKVESLDFVCYRDELSPTYLGVEEIELNALIGTYRSTECSSSTTWISYLDQTRKGLFFNTYKKNKSDFARFLSTPTQEEADHHGLPEVVKVEGGFLIYEGGKHRLTTGKILGLQKALVAVYG
ncbi:MULTISPECIES: hypothetical protein [Bacillus]|uniref:hypothetical protein n=1 Tax=Bacillus TaxID=1386 RepID=UPI00273EED6D|nr:hypothetical protein [Bacillus sp. MMSF_3328]